MGTNSIAVTSSDKHFDFYPRIIWTSVRTTALNLNLDPQDIPKIVTMDSGHGTPSDVAEIDSNGLITCNQKAIVEIYIRTNAGRITSTVQSLLLYGMSINGAAILKENTTMGSFINDDDNYRPDAGIHYVEASIGDTRQFKVWTDSSGDPQSNSVAPFATIFNANLPSVTISMKVIATRLA